MRHPGPWWVSVEAGHPPNPATWRRRQRGSTASASSEISGAGPHPFPERSRCARALGSPARASSPAIVSSRSTTAPLRRPRARRALYPVPQMADDAIAPRPPGHRARAPGRSLDRQPSPRRSPAMLDASARHPRLAWPHPGPLCQITQPALVWPSRTLPPPGACRSISGASTTTRASNGCPAGPLRSRAQRPVQRDAAGLPRLARGGLRLT